MIRNTVLIGLSVLCFSVQGQQSETFKKGGKTLLFTSDEPDFDMEVKSGLVTTFFKVYPKMVNDFNPKATDTIHVKIDSAYEGVAYAHNGKIVISLDWLRKKPNDLDVITHESMHIVQSYPPGSGPGWLTEGIADYVRYKYGVDNEGAEWFLPEYSSESSYKDSYRITARFLAWAVKNYDRNLVFTLDKRMREKTYSKEIWKEKTGKTIDELWDAYSKNPSI